MKVQFLYGSTGGKKEEEGRSIYVRVFHGELHYKKTLGLQINKKEWRFPDAKKNIEGGVIDLTTGSRSPERSAYLQTIKETLSALQTKYTNEFIQLKVTRRLAVMNKEDWRVWCSDIFDNVTGVSSAESERERTSFLTDVINEFINYQEETGRGKESTIKTYRSRLDKIKEFEDATFKLPENNLVKKARRILTTEVDSKFYTQYKYWLENIEGKKTATFGGHIRLIKATAEKMKVLRSELMWHPFVYSADFKDLKPNVPKPKLTPEEIEKLFNYAGKKKLENVRDLAKILYYGCMRYSDLKEALDTPVHEWQVYSKVILVDGERQNLTFWDLRQQKTDSYKSIVMNQEIKEMYDSDSLPRLISDQKLRNYLSDLAGEVGIKKQVGTHIFRRSYITNKINEGVHPSLVRLVSGHDSWSAFDSYCRDNVINWTPNP